MTVPRQISVLTPPIHPPSTSPGIFHQVIILLCASRALKHRCLTFAQVPKKYRSNLYPPNLLPTGNGEGSQLIYGPLPGPLWSFYPFCSSCSLLRHIPGHKLPPANLHILIFPQVQNYRTVKSPLSSLTEFNEN